ncbi:ABC transporter ATP-binding protein [Seohaeicola saemankumensis]|uniref:ABC transporter ATP-binding protein n=1 Tax=Seohaeicola saemankumensis TaxID=481181 RepID=UPI0035CF2B19
MSPLLSVEDLHLAFGRHRAVEGVGFTVGRGETVALVGESGSGKSATALAILRLIEREGGAITAGRITLHGQAGADDLELTALAERQLQQVRGNRISMVFQEPMTALNPVMRLGHQVAEVLRLHQGLDRRQSRAAVIDAFAKVGIPDPAARLDQFPHELSGGLRQRVMIAMALACRPDLLIADEPTTALDVTTQAGILDLIRSLQAETGMAVLFITHDMGVVAEIADRVVVLQHGRKVEEGRVGQIFARPGASYTRQLMAATPILGSGAPLLPAKAARQARRATPPVLEARNLSVRFPVSTGRLGMSRSQYHAVNGVSLTLGRGETLGLVGESGCGKSTLARALLRLVPSAEGRILWEGQDVTDMPAASLRPLRAKAQMIFQDPFASLNPRLPVRDLITEPARLAGQIAPRDLRDLAVELLRKVGLEDAAADRYAHQFSGGQRQRLCIARALSVKPALIVADEAVSALDVSVARQITDLMAQLQQEEGISFLFISHDIAVVERVSHRVAVMFAGQIVETGRTDDVLRHPSHRYTRQLLSAVPVADPKRRGRARGAGPLMTKPPLLLAKGQAPERWTLKPLSDHHAAVADDGECAGAGAGAFRPQGSGPFPDGPDTGGGRAAALID